jgi:hypothetical protein
MNKEIKWARVKQNIPKFEIFMAMFLAVLLIRIRIRSDPDLFGQIRFLALINDQI